MEESVNSLASTAFTRVKNHYEALRSDIGHLNTALQIVNVA